MTLLLFSNSAVWKLCFSRPPKSMKQVLNHNEHKALPAWFFIHLRLLGDSPHWLVHIFLHNTLYSIASSSILQVFSNVYRLLLSLWSLNGVAKRVPSFDTLCRAWTGVAKRAIAFDSLCGGRTEAPKYPLTISAELEWGLRECLLAFDSLWTGLVILTSNVYSLCELHYYWSKFRTIPLIIQTSPPFREKSLINVFHTNARNDII